LRFIGYLLLVRRDDWRSLSMLCCKSSSKIAKRSSSCFVLSRRLRVGFCGLITDRERTRRFGFIVCLLAHRNGLRRIAHLHAERSAGSRDAEVLIADAADQVERLLRRLLLCEAKRVGLDLGLDRRSHVRSRAEVPICRYQTIDALVRSLKVVVLDEQLQPPQAVREVSEHGLGQKLLP
jgi:hypothetical protein